MDCQLLEVLFEEEYNEFIQTVEGQKWKDDWINKNNGHGDLGDFIYDFYPEYLQ